MPIAICPGSFDPVTKGHIDIIERTAVMFSEVVVLVLPNANKAATFSLKQRMAFISASTAHLANVSVDSYDGMLVDYCRNLGAKVIVKGLRAVTDFEYEFQMALINKKLNKNIETMFLTTDSKYMYLSSSIVRQVASLGGDIVEFVPKEVAQQIEFALRGTQK